MDSNYNNFGIIDNRYILLKVLGSGASSTVYKVKDVINNQEYALKLINNDDEKEIENEIKINQKITNSQNQCFTKFITSSVLYLANGKAYTYIILELASKGSVINYINKDYEGLVEKLCKLFFAKLLLILQTLHQMGICHRDLKLDNFLFDENFNIKLSDFGFSSFIKKYKIGKKKKQTEYLGTSHYIAPEILMEMPYDGEKADIFSLGVILFNLRTCKYGFINASIDDSYYKFVKKKKINTYWKILGENIKINGLSEEFKNLYIKMISFNPKERPTIQEIYNDEWLREIRDLNELQLMDLEQELINELKGRE